MVYTDLEFCTQNVKEAHTEVHTLSLICVDVLSISEFKTPVYKKKYYIYTGGDISNTYRSIQIHGEINGGRGQYSIAHGDLQKRDIKVKY